MHLANLASCSKIICTHMWDSPAPVQTYSPHRGIINCVVWNHTNKALASCSVDGKIVLVSTEKPDQAAFELSFDPSKVVSVNSCAFSSNSRYIAAGGADSVVKIWDMKSATKEVPMTLRSHFGSVTSVAWSKLDDIVASSSMIGDIFLNSAKNGNVIENFASKGQQSINMIRFSQGQSHNRLGACTSSGSVLVWDITKRAEMCSFINAHKSPASALSFSSFNPVLMVSCSLDQNMNFYDISDKKQVKTITAEQSLNSVSFHSDGHTLVAGGMYGGLYIYDLRKPNAPKERLVGHESSVKYVDFLKEKDSGPNSTKFTSILSTNKNSMNTEPIKKDNLISTVPVLIQKPVAVSTNNISDKHRSVTKVDSTSTLIGAQQSVNKPLQQPTIKHSHSHSNNSFDQTSQHSQPPSAHVNNNYVRYTPQQKPSSNELVSKELFHQFEKRLRDDISESFQLIHLQIIRQFQIQQKQTESLLQSMLTQNQRKDEYIKRLQQQNQKLKKVSY